MNIEEFKSSLDKINIKLTDYQLDQLEMYYHLLVEWNSKINLTAITEKEQVYLKHFYDSLTLAKIIDLNQKLSLLDIGTGAGFPGIVLKIAFPNLKIVLLDSLNKRIEFLKLVINELNLKDIEAIHGRAEEFAQNNREVFDIATARAVAPLNILLEYAIPTLKEKGYFIPMKANISQEILASTKALTVLDCKVIDKSEFRLPKEDSLRTLVKIQKQTKTNKKFPRKYAEIKKRPL